MTEPKPTYTPRKRAPGAGPKVKPGKSFLVTIRCTQEEYEYIMEHTTPVDRAYIILVETGK
jgi:hypothetical protein